jgi:hypothetical protein
LDKTLGDIVKRGIGVFIDLFLRRALCMGRAEGPQGRGRSWIARVVPERVAALKGEKCRTFVCVS